MGVLTILALGVAFSCCFLILVVDENPKAAFPLVVLFFTLMAFSILYERKTNCAKENNVYDCSIQFVPIETAEE